MKECRKIYTPIVGPLKFVSLSLPFCPPKISLLSLSEASFFLWSLSLTLLLFFMSSSPSLSSSSSSSRPSTSHTDSGNAAETSTARQRRGGDFEGPSSSRRRRSVSEVWPEPFIEALATRIAIFASRNVGRLAAAAALANIFQVCSTWRAVSRSELLWRRLTRRIWRRDNLLHDTWRDEYLYWHRTARNFQTGRYTHTRLYFDPSDVDDPEGLTCRCLSLSDTHLACGFADGAVRLFDLATRSHVSTYRPHHRDRLGFSRAVTGIVLHTSRVIFATLHGDIHVAVINGGQAGTRRVCLGDWMNDGVLVDFSGSGRWWVGLFAGVPGRAIHIWDGLSEELVFVGGSLTDPEAVTGWHMLSDLTGFVGRVRVTAHETAIACTSARVIVFDLHNQGVVLADDQYRRGIVVTSVDVSNGRYVVVGTHGMARVRRVDTAEELCRFTVVGAGQMGVMGSINGGYALMCGGGVVRVWEVERGEYLYSLNERVGGVSAFECDERHVVAWGSDTSLHLWDFGADAEVD